MNRQVVKTDRAEILIPEIDFEVKKQTGLITNIEGLIDRAVDGLRETVQSIRATDPENVIKLTNYIVRLEELKEMNSPFTFVSTSAR